MANPIGLQVRELAGPSSPVLNPADLTNIGVIVKSLRGPVNKIIFISSLKDYEIIFGPVTTANQYVSYYEVRSLFQNAAPYDINVYCLRPANSGSLGVSATIAFGTSPNQITFTASYYGDVSSGTYNNNLKVEVVADGSLFKCNVYDSASGSDVLIESIGGLSTTTIEGTLQSQSRYVTAVITGSYSLAACTKTALASGTAPTAPTNLSATEFGYFDNYSIQTIFAPEWTALADHQAMEVYCSGRNDCMGLVAATYASTTSDLATTYGALSISKSFLAGYFNWIKVANYTSGGTAQWIPGLGGIIGAYFIKQMMAEGGNPFVPPGGMRTSILGVLGQKYELSASAVEVMVHTNGWNVIQYYKGKGFVTRTSRTLSTTSKHYSIHIRRSINFLISTFRNTLGEYEQRQNNPRTRAQLQNAINLFLSSQYSKGMFEKEGGFDNNVRVTCDETNNDVNVRQTRQLVVDIYMNFAEVAETVYVNLVQMVGGFDVNVI